MRCLIARVGGGTGGKGKVAKGEGNADVCVYRERERERYTRKPLDQTKLMFNLATLLLALILCFFQLGLIRIFF
jgi:hypothetical protein